MVNSFDPWARDRKADGAYYSVKWTPRADAKDDPAFKKVVDNAMIQTYKSGAISAIYEKWFQKPVPPRNINLNVPMSEQFKKVIKNPTDSGDPKDYQ